MTATSMPDAQSAATSPAETMAEPVPLFAEWVDYGFTQMSEAQSDALTSVDMVTQMVAKAAAASTECHLRMIAIAYANAGAALGLVRELVTAESPARLVELSADGARRQAGAAVAQLRELYGLAGKVATQTAEPISANITRALKQAA
jgi:hypothetical protein